MRRVVIVNCLAVMLILTVMAVTAPSADRTLKGLPVALHTRVTLTGTTLGSRAGQHMKGHVFATARWNHGPQYVVAVPATDSVGRWKVTFHPSRRGYYQLRILTPDSGVLEYAFLVG